MYTPECLLSDACGYVFKVADTNSLYSWNFIDATGGSISGGAPAEVDFCTIDDVNGVEVVYAPTPAPTAEPTAVPTPAPTPHPPQVFFDSGWFSLSSQAGTSSFSELQHYMPVRPRDVRVMVMPTSGNNTGFVFEGMGSSMGDDSRRYGGVVFAYGNDTIRIWAPDENDDESHGRIVNIGEGWGGEKKSQASSPAMVRVVANSTDCSTAFDYDSGWFSMSSQAGTDSFKELSHALGQYPMQVKVMAMAVDGDNEGYIFEGVGGAQSDDSFGNTYGGIVFGYSNETIRLWAPDSSSTTGGSIINVADGWGGEENAQSSSSAMVRVVANTNHTCGAADYDSGWMSLSAQDSVDSFMEVGHGLTSIPARVQVRVCACVLVCMCARARPCVGS